MEPGAAAVTGRGNSFANGPDGESGNSHVFGPVGVLARVLGWEYVWARAMSTTIYDLGG